MGGQLKLDPKPFTFYVSRIAHLAGLTLEKTACYSLGGHVYLVCLVCLVFWLSETDQMNLTGASS